MHSTTSFADNDALTYALAALLATHLSAPGPGPHAIMLAGGSTPMAAYGRVARLSDGCDAGLRILFSDDRHVPPENPKSNFGHTAPLLRALQIPNDRVIRVHGEWPLEQATRRFDEDLRDLAGSGCRFTLGLLGLGTDGHTASLFSAEDIGKARGHWAIGVTRPDGLMGVSATPQVFQRFERILFVVTGRDKRAALARLLEQPMSIAAGLAVANCPRVEVWCDAAAR